MTDIKLHNIPHMNTNSFFCFSSRTGCLIIGYVGAILASIFAVGSLTIAVIPILEDDSSMFVLLMFSAGISVAGVYVHYSLIQGVEKQEPRKMYLWIYINYICLIVSIYLIGLSFILLTIVLISRNFKDFDRKKSCITISLLYYIVCLSAIIEGINYYFFAAVVTHCQDLILMKSRGRIYTP